MSTSGLASRLPLLGPLFEAGPAGPEPRPRLETIRDHRIHSVEFGEGNECVLLIHGLAGSSRWWRHNVAALARRYRVVIPDLIGFGKTPRSLRTLPAPDVVALILSQWMERLAISRAHVVGHSMGGQLAIHLAADVPDRIDRLVLADAAGIPRKLGPRQIVQFLAGVTPLSSWGRPRFFPVIVRDAVRAGPLTLLQAAAHILRDDVRPLLPRIEAPTLIVWGESDRWVPLDHSRQLANGIPDARRVVLHGAAHNPMVDRPDAFNRLVLDFLSEGGAGE